jgi:hypothetical protein
MQANHGQRILAIARQFGKRKLSGKLETLRQMMGE